MTKEQREKIYEANEVLGLAMEDLLGKAEELESVGLEKEGEALREIVGIIDNLQLMNVVLKENE